MSKRSESFTNNGTPPGSPGSFPRKATKVHEQPELLAKDTSSSKQTTVGLPPVDLSQHQETILLHRKTREQPFGDLQALPGDLPVPKSDECSPIDICEMLKLKADYFKALALQVEVAMREYIQRE